MNITCDPSYWISKINSTQVDLDTCAINGQSGLFGAVTIKEEIRDSEVKSHRGINSVPTLDGFGVAAHGASGE